MTTSIQCQTCKNYKGLYTCTEYGDVPMNYYHGEECPMRDAL